MTAAGEFDLAANRGRCTWRIGPVWKLDGDMCGCILPAGHQPSNEHKCSCGAHWWEDPSRVDQP